jgi:uncharacterized protein (DUF433 family)
MTPLPATAIDPALPDEADWEDLLKIQNVVRSDPEVVSGTPVFLGTRVPVDNLIDYLQGGDTLDEFLDQFPSVSREQAIAALEIAREALVHAAHARSDR